MAIVGPKDAEDRSFEDAGDEVGCGGAVFEVGEGCAKGILGRGTGSVGLGSAGSLEGLPIGGIAPLSGGDAGAAWALIGSGGPRPRRIPRVLHGGVLSSEQKKMPAGWAGRAASCLSDLKRSKWEGVTCHSFSTFSVKWIHGYRSVFHRFTV
jgi:hypothetical protein